MGNCVSSNSFTPTEHLPGQSYSVLTMALELGYDRTDVDRMHRFFSKYDNEKSGIVYISEFLSLNDITSEALGKMLFKIFDDDESGMINFEEFVLACYHCLSCSEYPIVEFAFRVFDTARQESLSSHEINKLVDAIWGPTAGGNQHIYAAVNKRSKKSKNGHLSLAEFIALTKQHPILLLPVNELQNQLKKNTLGAKKWQKISENRMQFFGNENFVNILTSLKVRPQALEKGMSDYDNSKRSKSFLEFPQCYQYKSSLNRELSQILESSQELKIDPIEIGKKSFNEMRFTNNDMHLKSRFKNNQNKIDEARKDLIISLHKENTENKDHSPLSENSDTTTKNKKSNTKKSNINNSDNKNSDTENSAIANRKKAKKFCENPIPEVKIKDYSIEKLVINEKLEMMGKRIEDIKTEKLENEVKTIQTGSPSLFPWRETKSSSKSESSNNSNCNSQGSPRSTERKNIVFNGNICTLLLHQNGNNSNFKEHVMQRRRNSNFSDTINSNEDGSNLSNSLENSQNMSANNTINNVIKLLNNEQNNDSNDDSENFNNPENAIKKKNYEIQKFENSPNSVVKYELIYPNIVNNVITIQKSASTDSKNMSLHISNTVKNTEIPKTKGQIPNSKVAIIEDDFTCVDYSPAGEKSEKLPKSEVDKKFKSNDKEREKEKSLKGEISLDSNVNSGGVKDGYIVSSMDLCEETGTSTSKRNSHEMLIRRNSPDMEDLNDYQVLNCDTLDSNDKDAGNRQIDADGNRAVKAMKRLSKNKNKNISASNDSNDNNKSKNKNDNKVNNINKINSNRNNAIQNDLKNLKKLPPKTMKKLQKKMRIDSMCDNSLEVEMEAIHGNKLQTVNDNITSGSWKNFSSTGKFTYQKGPSFENEALSNNRSFNGLLNLHTDNENSNNTRRLSFSMDLLKRNSLYKNELSEEKEKDKEIEALKIYDTSIDGLKITKIKPVHKNFRTELPIPPLSRSNSSSPGGSTNNLDALGVRATNGSGIDGYEFQANTTYPPKYDANNEIMDFGEFGDNSYSPGKHGNGPISDNFHYSNDKNDYDNDYCQKQDCIDDDHLQEDNQNNQKSILSGISPRVKIAPPKNMENAAKTRRNSDYGLTDSNRERKYDKSSSFVKRRSIIS